MPDLGCRMSSFSGGCSIQDPESDIQDPQVVGGTTMFALNFYSTVFTEQLRDGRKTATIRLGDKRDKYETGQVVWLTVGRRFGTRKKVAAAIIDAVEVKALRDVTPREIQRDNPELRRHEELIEFLSNIYGRERLIGLDDTVTVIHFSRVEE